MGHVEIQRISGGLGCERRLSFPPRQKLQIPRPPAQISRQQRSQRPARRDEAIPVAIESKARGSPVLVVAQMRMQQCLRGGIEDQVGLADVNLIGRQSRRRLRVHPLN